MVSGGPAPYSGGEVPRDIRDEPLYGDVLQHFRRSIVLGRANGIEEVALSPDGARIAFTATLYEEFSGLPFTRIELVETGSGACERITFGPRSDANPQFSPDARALAFLSDRSGHFQLYLLDPAHPRQVTAAPVIDGVVESFAWSPDGTAILLLVAGVGADLSGAQGSGALASGVDALPSWTPYVEEAIPADSWRRIWIWEVGSAAAVPLSTQAFTAWEAAWCGNEAVVAVISSDPRESAWYGARLEHLARRTGERRVLLASREDQLGLARGSPSGAHVAVVQACCSDRMVIAGDVWLIDAASAKARRFDTNGVDVSALAWRNDETLCYIGSRGFECAAGEIGIRDERSSLTWVTRETTGGRMYPDAAFGSDGSFAAILHSYERFPAIVLVRNGEARVVRDCKHDGAAYLREVGGKLEACTWKGRDGLEIGGYVATPDRDGPHPLVVLVHGGPVWAFRDAWSMSYVFTPLLVKHGYAVLHPNPRGSGGRGQDYARRVRGDLLGEDAYDILAGIDLLITRGIADRKRLAVMGRSYGGQMSSWLVTQTNRFGAAIPMAPLTDNLSAHFTTNIPDFMRRFLAASPYDAQGAYFARSAVMFARSAVTPTLHVAGALDRCTPPGQAMEFHRALVENGVPSELVIYPEEGHHVDRLETRIDLCTRILAWLDRYTGERSSS